MLRNRCKVDGNADRKIRIFFETHALLAEEQRQNLLTIPSVFCNAARTVWLLQAVALPSLLIEQHKENPLWQVLPPNEHPSTRCFTFK